ncbi:MAG: glycosyltransferase family 4 protein [Symploca sp. SIO2G7]|nr:glycosyltransferase family 4 protein [Symploca sp. SIO2G7]
MEHCIWYISKYVSVPGKASAGERGYMLMRELSKLGYQCLIITSDSNPFCSVPALESPYFLEEIDGLQICWVRTLKYSVAKSLRRIFSWLDFEWRLLTMPKAKLPHPNVLVVSSLSLLTILNGFLLRRRFGCRLIFEVRDIWPLTLTEEGGFSKYNPFVLGLAMVEWLGYKYADVIVGMMPNLREHVTDVLGYEREVGCIPIGIDVDNLQDTLEIPIDYEKTYIPNDKFIVAYAGTVGITNALETLLKCAESLTDNNKIHFLIVGDGDLKAEYEAKYGHLHNLTFAPKVPKRMVQSILMKCDLLYFSVHESRIWRYGQSLNKIIDYMLTGKPVIASYSGFPSMINEARCGTYVPAGDVVALRDEIVRYLAMSKAEHERIGIRGRAWLIEHRNYVTLAKNYLAVMLS